MRATPNTAPVRHWVVDTGKERRNASETVTAASAPSWSTDIVRAATDVAYESPTSFAPLPNNDTQKHSVISAKIQFYLLKDALEKLEDNPAAYLPV